MNASGAEITVKTGANSCGENALRGMPGCARDAASRQAIEGERVALHRLNENSPNAHDFAGGDSSNPNAGNDMQAFGARAANSLLGKLLAVNRLRGFGLRKGHEVAEEMGKNLTRISTLVRWCRFNLVGAVGILVQFSVLFLLKSVLNFNYLAATAFAVEVAVVHNFFWHERFTWAERVRLSWKKSLPRFLRFNLTTGLLSIGGNLGMMRVMVGRAHMNYLAANGIAIAVCSLLNFAVSDGWVFGVRKSDEQAAVGGGEIDEPF
jgi:putative flippase GtrA